MAAWDEVLDGTEMALNSSGTATERMEIQAESLTGKLNSLQSSWDSFVMSLGTNEIIKTVVDLLTGLVGILNTLLNNIPVLSSVIKGALVAGALNTLLGAISKLSEMAKTGGFLGGLISSETIANFAKAIKNDAVGAINILVQSFKRAKNSGKGLSSAFEVLGASLKEFSAGRTTVAEGIGAIGVAEAGAVAPTVSLTGAISALWAALWPMLAIGAIVAGISALADAIGEIEYNNSVEKLVDDVEASGQALEETRGELSDVESQIADIRSQMAELNTEGPISITDKQQTVMLQEQLQILQEQQRILKEQAIQDAIKDAQTNMDLLSGIGEKNWVLDQDSEGRNTFFSRAYLNGGVYASGDALPSSNDSDDRLDAIISKYETLIELEKQYQQDGSEVPQALIDAIGYLEENLSYWQSIALDAKSAYNEALLSGASEDELSNLKEEADLAEKVYNEITRVLDPTGYNQLKISELIDTTVDTTNLQQQISNLQTQLSEGLIDEETFNQNVKDIIYKVASDSSVQQAFQDNLGDLFDVNTDSIAQELANKFGVSLNAAVNSIDISSFDGLKNSIESSLDELNNTFSNTTSEFNDAMDEMKSSMDMSSLNNAIDSMGNAINSYQDQLDSLNSTFSDLGTNVNNAATVIDTVTSNMDALTGEVTLTAAETQDLYDTFSSLPTVIDPMTGEVYDGFTLANIAIGNTSMTAGESQEYVASFLSGVQGAGNNTITVMNYVIDAINQVKSALASALTTASDFVSSASKMIGNLGNSLGGKITSLVFGIDESDFASAQNSLNSLASQLKSQASSITKSVNKSKASMIQQTELYEQKLKNAGNTAQNAYDKAIKGANGAASGAGSAADATDDLTDALKKQYEAEKSLLETRKEALQAQKEANQDELDGLNDAKDAINDLLDMTMKMLKQQYEDEQDALDNQLDAFEDKINKQKDYLELLRDEEEHQDELAEKNRSIADIQAQLEELRYDTSASGQAQRLELLDKLNEAQKELSDYQADYDYNTKQDSLDKELDSFKAQIDAQKEYIKNVLMDEANLYQEAIALIEGKTDAFYQSLVNWNLRYGDHTVSTVKLAWDACYDALNRYGYLGVGVQGILEGIAYRCNDIENENKAIEESIKAIENEMKSLEDSYNAAVKAAQDLANASNSARDAANGATSAYNNLQAVQNAKPTFYGGGNLARQSVSKYHTGTDYVKPVSSWLNDMLGLNEDETAAILKKGEAVIPDYANPFNDDGKYNSNFAVASPSTIAPASNNDVEYNYKVEIGDIVIEGDADENTVKQLRKVKDEITNNVFKTINKLQNIGGYKNTKIAH